MKISRNTLGLAVAAVALAIAAPALAAGFIRFEGVDGETAVSRANIEVSSVRWGAAMRTEGCSGESGPGRLMVSGAGLRGVTPGSRIPQATLHVRKQGSEPALIYKLKDVIISSATGGTAPSESMSLNYARISWSKEGCR